MNAVLAPVSGTGVARAQIYQGSGRPFALQEIALPETLAPGEVLVRVTLATICGSDLHTVDGRRESPTPCVLGHEAVGRVERSARDGIDEGARVTWTIADSCGHCAECGEYHLPQKCESLFKYGHADLTEGTGLNGCYATHILLRPGTAIFPVPDDLPDEVAAPANCALATMVNVISHLPDACRTVWVQGGGLLGLYGCALLRHRGVETVFCSDLHISRLGLAEDFGGRAVEAGPDLPARLRRTVPRGLDAVIEVAGAPQLIPAGMEALRPGGMYLWAGMVHPETALELTGETVVRKCLEIRGVHNYAPEHLRAGLRFLGETHRKLPYEKLVSPPFSLDGLEEAFELARQRIWLRVGIRP